MSDNWNIDQIKQQDIVALIGADVPLHRKGSIYKGCCPFHEEDTPSFAVYPDDGTFHCFGAGCGKKGSHIDYILLKNGLPNDPDGVNQAIDLLTDFYGIQKKVPTKANGEPVLVTDKKRARRIVQEYLVEGLKNCKELIDYLDDREVVQGDRDYWGCGAGTGTMLKDLKDRISLNTLVQIGIIREVTDEDKGTVKHFDFIQKGWLSVPIYDENKNISHWWLRSPKEKNHKQWYNKCKQREDLLLNMIDLISKDECYIVEGFFEAVQVRKHGKPVAALMGVGHKKQIGLLKSLRHANKIYPELSQTKKLYIWLDRDDKNSGQKGSEVLASELWKYHEVYVLKCPNIGTDPDDYLRKENGKIDDIEKVKYSTTMYPVEATPQGYLYCPNGGKEVAPEIITNFTMDIKYHFLTKEDRTRMITISRNGSKTRQLSMTGDDMYNRNAFCRFLAKKTKDAVMVGDNDHFEKLMQYIRETDPSDTITMSQHYGNIENGTWLFDNCAIMGDGRVVEADSDGIIWIKYKGVDGIRTQAGTDFEDQDIQRQMVPDDYDSLLEIVEQMIEYYPTENVMAAIGFIVSMYCRTEIIGFYEAFPHDFKFGGTNSGKTKMTRIQQSWLGATNLPTSTCKTTDKAFLRHFAAFKNLPLHLSEYIPKFGSILVDIYDQNLYNQAKKTQGYETLIGVVNTGCIFTCMYTPADEHVLNRCVIHNFNRIKKDVKEKKKGFDKMFNRMVMQKAGIGFLMGLLETKVRERIIPYSQRIADALLDREEIEPLLEKHDRIIQTYSIVYAGFMALYNDKAYTAKMRTLFHDKAGNEFTFDSFIDLVVDHILDAYSIIKGENKLHAFFQNFNRLFVNERLDKFAQKVPATGPATHIRFLLEPVFLEVVDKDRTGKFALENVSKNDISHQINEDFGVYAQSDWMRSMGKNVSCYTLPLADLENRFGITFTSISDEEDVTARELDEMEERRNPTPMGATDFDPEKIEKGMF